LSETSYAQRAVELQRSLLKTKGAEACVEEIERFMENGGCDELFPRSPSWLKFFSGALAPLSLLAAGAAGACLLQHLVKSDRS